MSELKDVQTFLNDLVTAFPEVKDEVLDDGYEDLIALQVGCLTKFTQAAINTEDWKTVDRCIKFVNENFENVEFSVENSLAISYLGQLNFPQRTLAEKLLPKKLFEIREALLQHYETLTNLPHRAPKKIKKEARYRRS